MITLLFIITVLTTAITCNPNLTGPYEDPPGRRDYAWTVDTINVPLYYVNKIWGSSPENVWIIGTGGSLATNIWHYDGITWKTDNVSRGINPKSIIGFNQNDVWIAGNEGEIWHFDGKQWSRNYKYQHNINLGFYAFNEIYGDSPGNIYATGFTDSADVRTTLLMRYNGSYWWKMKIPKLAYQFVRIRKGLIENLNYYLLGYSEDSSGKSTIAIYEFNGKNLKSIYESIYSSQTRASIQAIQGKIYIIIGNTIFRYVNNVYKLIKEVDMPNFGLGIHGRSEKDIFLRMEDGIAHYNGTDIEYLLKFKGDIYLCGAMIFDNHVFFIANDFNTGLNLVYKGELRQ